MIRRGAEPFFLKGNNTGVLLIHGFTGSPAELLLLGQFLNSAGFTVLGVRLAGHATNENDLIKTTQENWFNTVLDGFEILSGACEKIFVVGHSMGGLLALKLSAVREVEKVVTISAPIFVDESLGAENLPPRELCGVQTVLRPQRRLKNVPPAVNHVYRKMPLISVHELFDLIETAKKNLSKVKTPLLILHAKDDHTAQSKSAEFIFENVSSEILQIKFFEVGGHLLPLTESRDEVFAEVERFLKEVF